MGRWGDGWTAEQAAHLDALEDECEPWRLRRAEAHEAEARRAAQARDRTRERWHAGRARRLRMGWRERARVCRGPGADELVQTCEGCGRRHARPLPCGHARWWCRRCAYREGRRLRERMELAVRAHLARARAEWVRQGARRRARPDLALLTLTIRHSGDLARDRERIAQGWRRMRAWLHRRIGAPAYWGVWEVTAGRDGLGHVHLHVITIWPWVDYRELREEWERATDGHGRVVDVQRSRYRLRDGQQRRWTEHRAARYVAKYLTKSGEVALSLPPTIAAAWIGATYGRRLVTASRGAWVREPEPMRDCPDCGWDVAWTHVRQGGSDGEPHETRGPPDWVHPAHRADAERAALAELRAAMRRHP